MIKRFIYLILSFSNLGKKAIKLWTEIYLILIKLTFIEKFRVSSFSFKISFQVIFFKIHKFFFAEMDLFFRTKYLKQKNLLINLNTTHKKSFNFKIKNAFNNNYKIFFLKVINSKMI